MRAPGLALTAPVGLGPGCLGLACIASALPGELRGQGERVQARRLALPIAEQLPVQGDAPAAPGRGHGAQLFGAGGWPVSATGRGAASPPELPGPALGGGGA